MTVRYMTIPLWFSLALCKCLTYLLIYFGNLGFTAHVSYDGNGDEDSCQRGQLGWV